MSYSGAYFSCRMLFIQKFRCSILWPAFVIGNRNISIFNGRSDMNELSDRMYMRKNSQSQTRWEQLAPKFTVEKFNHEKRNQSGIGFRFLDGIWSEKKIGLLSSQGCHLLFGRICVCNVPTNRRSIQLVLRTENLFIVEVARRTLFSALEMENMEKSFSNNCFDSARTPGNDCGDGIDSHLSRKIDIHESRNCICGRFHCHR